MKTDKKYILTKEVAAKKMRRMAYEILENNINEQEIILAGIREKGAVVANVIRKILSEISSLNIKLVTLQLDKNNPKDVLTEPAAEVADKVIIVIDDVSNSGKTLLYALKPFLDFHPKKIQILVLVERSHSSFPVRPDYVGLSIATTIQEHIYVEVDGEEVKGAYMQ
ncbi:MAG TPA: phosphoribosyltransferase family protein [Chitinophagaceae bacterium]|nr:phosphoribosyltransferase family protein [Chitinophagaceae bacterium]